MNTANYQPALRLVRGQGPGWILCAHADGSGPAHWLAPGEKCQIAKEAQR